MSKAFVGKTPGRAEWKRIKSRQRGERLSRMLHRKVEWLPDAKAGAKEWNFVQLRDALVKSLRTVGMEIKAQHLEACHRAFHGWRCKTNPKHVWVVPDYNCHLRLCPFEMKARANRARRNIRFHIDKLEHPKYMVLSKRNCGLDDLAQGIDSLFRSLARFHKDFLKPQGVRGMFAVLELTFNRENSSWHPHLNVLLDCPNYLPHEALLAAWIAATDGEGRGAWIGAIDKGTLFELLKYITKLFAFVDVPEAVAAFLTGTKRRRFIRSYGTLYGLDREDDFGEPFKRHCPDCHSADIEDCGIIPRCGAYWDALGCMRFIPNSDG